MQLTGSSASKMLRDHHHESRGTIFIYDDNEEETEEGTELHQEN